MTSPAAAEQQPLVRVQYPTAGQQPGSPCRQLSAGRVPGQWAGKRGEAAVAAALATGVAAGNRQLQHLLFVQSATAAAQRAGQWRQQERRAPSISPLHTWCAWLTATVGLSTPWQEGSGSEVTCSLVLVSCTLVCLSHTHTNHTQYSQYSDCSQPWVSPACARCLGGDCHCNGTSMLLQMTQP